MLLWAAEQKPLLSLSKCINDLLGEQPLKPSCGTCALNQPSKTLAWAAMECQLQPLTVQLSPQGAEECDERGRVRGK